jgi:nicotinamidase-related amidase
MKSALTIVDAQNFCTAGCPVTLQNIRESADSLRKVMVVIWDFIIPGDVSTPVLRATPEKLRRAFEGLGHDYLPTIMPHEDDYFVTRSPCATFEHTNLEEFLRENAITKHYLAGYFSSLCLQTAAEESADRGFETSVLAEHHADAADKSGIDFSKNNRIKIAIRQGMDLLYI